MEHLSRELRCHYVAAGHRTSDAAATSPTEGPHPHRDGTAFWSAIQRISDSRATRDSHLAVILHYSGYGYDIGGVPIWLAEALECRPAWFQGRIVTFFHELYAKSRRPWQRSFWSSGRQRAVAQRIACASDSMATNREQSARWLELCAGLTTHDVSHLPICSNVGEPTDIIPWDQRPRRAVTFGGARFKKAFLLGDGARRAARVCNELGIQELVDIGQPGPCDEYAFRSNGVSYTQVGYLPPEAVCAHFATARVALLNYFEGFWAKSGVLAAATAAGAVPLTPSRVAPSDGLVDGTNMLSIDDILNCPDGIDGRLPEIASNVVAWYGTHNVTCHATLLLRATGLAATPQDYAVPFSA
jgi:hypothetical protein